MAEYEEDGFQLLYKGTIYVNSTALDEPMNFMASTLAEKTDHIIRIGDVELVPAKTISINVTNSDGTTTTTATYVEGALEIHHGTDVYACEDCEDPFLGLNEKESHASFDGTTLKIETPAGRHLRIYVLHRRGGGCE